mmetsp:Transcript_15930/g.34612  ORF Transcript_15930/g.34612 Transcript_15930/m.34612 type:complete len:291 (-) Transcript_15930:350-1222(-)
MEYEPDDDYQHGEGFSEHMLSPWEDRHFWETTARVANNNHFYRTGSSFTDGSGDGSGENSVDRAGDGHGAKDGDSDDYQVMVERVVDEDGLSSYHLRTNEENMDDIVQRAIDGGEECIRDTTSDDSKQKNEYGSVFRPPYEAKLQSDVPPPLALSASSSSEATTDVEEDTLHVVDQKQVIVQKDDTMQILRSTPRRFLVPCVFLALLICYVLYLLPTHTDGAKLTGTIVHNSPVHDTIVNAVNEYATGNDHVGIIAQIVSLFKAFANVELWRSHATELVSGALQTSWVKW